MLEIMRANPLGKNAQIIGTCVEDENCFCSDGNAPSVELEWWIG